MLEIFEARLNKNNKIFKGLVNVKSKRNISEKFNTATQRTQEPVMNESRGTETGQAGKPGMQGRVYR